MKTSRDSLRKLVVTSILSAISIVLVVTPFGMIPWGSTSLTTMHIPVIIGTILEGPIVGLITGAVFGLSSLIRAAVAPNGPVDPYFVNPLISVLPRIMIGLFTWFAYKAFQGKVDLAAIITASIIGSLTNTVFVLSSLALFGGIPWEIILTVLISNGLPEAAAAALIATAVVASWKGIEGRKQGSSLENLEEK